MRICILDAVDELLLSDPKAHPLPCLLLSTLQRLDLRTCEADPLHIDHISQPVSGSDLPRSYTATTECSMHPIPQ